MELTKQYINVVRNGVFPSNTYLLKSPLNNACLLIDPGLDTRAIDDKITELNLMPVAIVCTHGHFDHIGSVSYFKTKFDIPYYLHEADLKLSKSANFFLKIAGIDLQIHTPIPDILFKGKQDTISVDVFNLSVYNFPGHSAGSCVIKYDDYLFSGDIIYKNGLGFNNFPGEDKRKLKASIKEIFTTFSGNSCILPGHGDSEYLNNIIKQNEGLKQFLAIEDA